MWFHLLSVASFVALGSSQDFYGFSRAAAAAATPSCKGPDCPCNCPQDSCPPCPLPQQPECFNGCGTPTCPCLKPSDGLRANKPGPTPAPKKEFAAGVATVNVYPTGPVCSAFNILPILFVTINSCVAGKNIKDLYVSAYAPGATQILKVLEVQKFPYDRNEISVVILITEKKQVNVPYFAVPPLPINGNNPAEIQKWEVINNGLDYIPTRTTLKSFRKCQNETERNFICATTKEDVRMGWNDIGTPIAQLHGQAMEVQGIYIGDNLYRKGHEIKYLSVYPYVEWFFKMVNEYY